MPKISEIKSIDELTIHLDTLTEVGVYREIWNISGLSVRSKNKKGKPHPRMESLLNAAIDYYAKRFGEEWLPF